MVFEASSRSAGEAIPTFHLGEVAMGCKRSILSAECACLCVKTAPRTPTLIVLTTLCAAVAPKKEPVTFRVWQPLVADCQDFAFHKPRSPFLLRLQKAFASRQILLLSQLGGFQSEVRFHSFAWATNFCFWCRVGLGHSLGFWAGSALALALALGLAAGCAWRTPART